MDIIPLNNSLRKTTNNKDKHTIKKLGGYNYEGYNFKGNYCRFDFGSGKRYFNIIYIHYGFANISMIKVAAGTFISLNNYSTIGVIIGLCAHYTVGGVIGLAFLHFLKFTSDDYPIIKGIFAGLVAWLFLAGAFLKLGISEINPNDEASNLMLLIGHMIFGLSLGVLTKIFVLKKRKR